MRAAVYRRYGPPEVVHLEEVPKPEVGGHDVLVRVRATTVSAADWRLRSATVPGGFVPFLRLAVGVFRPRRKILGLEFAGEVESVGSGVTRFRPGERVFGVRGAGGCHAEYVALRESASIGHVPEGLSLPEAAALMFGGGTALHYLRDLAQIKEGEDVIVNGASGAVGSAAVQLAKHFGARVTAVCSGPNADLARRIGADDVIDYANVDFRRGDGTYDIIMDNVGNCSFANCRDVLKPRGRLLLVVASFGQLIGASLRSRRSGRRVLVGITPERAEHVRTLASLASAGAFRPVIDSTYPLERIVEAHRRVDSGHKRGNVIVLVP